VDEFTFTGLPQKADEVSRIDVPFDSGPPLVLSRTKKDGAWAAQGGPAGQKLLADKVSSLLTALTTLRFTDTVDPKDSAASEAASHMRVFTLVTFGGQTVTVSLGRKPEVKKLKAPVADKDALAALAKPADAKADEKPLTPEYDTTPAGPVFAVISNSDAKAPINDLMARRAFEVDEFTFTGLPQKADDLFEAPKAK
jgi:hypothetical protein